MTRQNGLSSLLNRGQMSRGMVWGILIIGALFAFEVFNYSTTDFALTDLLGDLKFAGVRWATLLAIAFCGIDFAGIARLFTPEQGADEPAEVWYLFGAWILAAGMNATLTWWGVSIAILQHGSLGNAVVPRETLIRVVPIFVAIMVWLIRILIIGTFSVAGERLFSQGKTRKPRIRRPISTRTQTLGAKSRAGENYRKTPAPSFRPAPKSNAKPEPTYHPVSMNSSQTQSNARTFRG